MVIDGMNKAVKRARVIHVHWVHVECFACMVFEKMRTDVKYVNVIGHLLRTKFNVMK